MILERLVDGAQRRWVGSLPVLFAFLAALAFLRPTLVVSLYSGIDYGLSLITHYEIYNRTVIATNYFEDGFIRRGLGGTIATLLSRDWDRSLLLFIAFSLVWALFPLAILVHRLAKHLPPAAATYLAFVLALSPQSFFGWSRDPGRTDLLVAGCLALAVIAWLDGRRPLAVLSILFGLLAHETAVVFGLPLLAAMGWADLRSGTTSRRQLMQAAGMAGAGIAVILLLQFLLSAPGPVVAANMLRAAPSLVDNPTHRLWRDIAIYMAVAGSDALKTAICYNLELNSQYWLAFFGTLGLLAVYTLVLPLRRHLLVAALVMWVPAVFMMLIANDTGRWLKLAVLNGWLIAAYHLLRGVGLDLVRWRDLIGGTILLALLLAMGITRYNDVNKAFGTVALKLGYQGPPLLEEWMNHCDPGWRRYVYPEGLPGPAGVGGK